MSKRKIKSVTMIVLALFLSIVKITLVPNHVDYNKDNVALSSGEARSSKVESVVSRVVDGDTLKVMIDNNEETVRLIGINTPESVDPRIKVECFGKEASLRMKEIVQGKNVSLVSDPTQTLRDKYHRFLYYVYLEDGTLINKKMIEDGYAFEYTYNIPYQFQAEFKQAEKDAKGAARGLWNPAACDYKSNPKKGK